MGREIKRVPLDFDWPIGKTWSGFISPKTRPCVECGRYGSTVDARWLETIVGLILTAGSDGVRGRLHPWLEALPLAPYDDDGVFPPTPRMAEISGGLAGRPPGSFLGHDAIDRWSATKAVLKAAGLPEDWGRCKVCDGHGIHPDDLAASEAWEPTEPPTGEGYQVWETVSEGSPITPVFATPEELARWCADNHPWDSNSSYETWLKFIAAGWAPSGVGTARGIVDGVESFAEIP